MDGRHLTLKIHGTRRFDLFCSNCVENMIMDLEPDSIDVIVTSPPYNLGIEYASYNDKISRETYLDFMQEWAVKISSVLSKQGSLFLNIGSKPKDPWVPFDVVGVMRRHFVLQNVIHWIKSIHIDPKNAPGMNAISLGHYKPINSMRFINDLHEYVFHLTLSGRVVLDRKAVGVPYKYKSNISRWRTSGEDLRCRGNTWFIPYDTIQNRSRERPHPATFPVDLARKCILLHGVKRTRKVLDPFMGLGNTALACIDLAVDFVGYEIDQGYYRESVDRIRTELQRSPGL